MPKRKSSLVTNEIYHVYNKSIAGYKIFNCVSDYERMIQSLDYYRYDNRPCSISHLLNRHKDIAHTYEESDNCILKYPPLVEIIAYCIMPTHFHLILKQLKDEGIKNFIHKILSSYSKYFNLKLSRKGPLWENRFKNILVDDDDYFIHLTRYIHLNPVTAGHVLKPEEWSYSSYKEYLGLTNNDKNICKALKCCNMSKKEYKNFTNDRKDYQEHLNRIKHLTLE